MINTAILEGIVVRTWSYNGYTFCRIRNRPDPGDEDPRNTYMFTIRLPAGMTAEQGQHIRVHGRLRTRAFREALSELMDEDLPEGVPDLQVPQHITELVAEKMLVINAG